MSAPTSPVPTKRAMEAPERPVKKARADVADDAVEAPEPDIDAATYDYLTRVLVFYFFDSLTKARDCWHRARVAQTSLIKHVSMAQKDFQTAIGALAQLRLAEEQALRVHSELKAVNKIKRAMDMEYTAAEGLRGNPLLESTFEVLALFTDDMTTTLDWIVDIWDGERDLLRRMRDKLVARHGGAFLFEWEIEPAVAADEPAVAADEPAVAADEPAAAADEPAATEE